MPSAPTTTSAVTRSPLAKDDDRLLVVLLEADAAMAGLHDVGRQPVHQHPEQIGAVHAVELDLPTRLRRPHRRDERAVRAAEPRVGPARPVAR